MNKVIAYVDGSYNKYKHLSSYGVVILDEDGNLIDKFGSSIPDIGYCNMRNVGGEIMGAEKAFEYAVKNNIKNLDIVYDYEGIEMWATNRWKCNNRYTKNYRDIYNKCRNNVNIRFIYVKAHSGSKYNDMADGIAKQYALI